MVAAPAGGQGRGGPGRAGSRGRTHVLLKTPPRTLPSSRQSCCEKKTQEIDLGERAVRLAAQVQQRGPQEGDAQAEAEEDAPVGERGLQVAAEQPRQAAVAAHGPGRRRLPGARCRVPPAEGPLARRPAPGEGPGGAPGRAPPLGRGWGRVCGRGLRVRCSLAILPAPTVLPPPRRKANQEPLSTPPSSHRLPVPPAFLRSPQVGGAPSAHFRAGHTEARGVVCVRRGWESAFPRHQPGLWP